MQAERPGEHGDRQQDEHTGGGGQTGQRDGDDAHDERGQGGTVHENLAEDGQTLPQHEVDDQRDDVGEGVHQIGRDGIGHLDGGILVLAELDDAHRDDRQEHGHEDAGAAQELGGDHGGGGLAEGHALGRGGDHEEEDHGDQSVGHGALHAEGVGVGVADRKGDGQGDEAHGHVIGHAEPLIHLVGGLQDAGDVEQGGDDHERGAREDEGHDGHHAVGDRGDHLVGLDLAAPLLQLGEDRALEHLLEFGHWFVTFLEDLATSRAGRWQA